MNLKLTRRLFLIVCLLLAGGALATAHAEEGRAAGCLSPAVDATAADALPQTDVGLPWRPASICHCLPGGRTRNYSASGASCVAVNNGILNAADAEAQTDCSGLDGVCFESAVNYTSPCTFVSGSWSGTGNISYKCKVCE